MNAYYEENYVVDGNDVICVCEEDCEEVELGHGCSDEEYFREFYEETVCEEPGDGFGSDFEEPFCVIFEEFEEDGKGESGKQRKIA